MISVDFKVLFLYFLLALVSENGYASNELEDAKKLLNIRDFLDEKTISSKYNKAYLNITESYHPFKKDSGVHKIDDRRKLKDSIAKLDNAYNIVLEQYKKNQNIFYSFNGDYTVIELVEDSNDYFDRFLYAFSEYYEKKCRMKKCAGTFKRFLYEYDLVKAHITSHNQVDTIRHYFEFAFEFNLDRKVFKIEDILEFSAVQMSVFNSIIELLQSRDRYLIDNGVFINENVKKNRIAVQTFKKIIHKIKNISSEKLEFVDKQLAYFDKNNVIGLGMMTLKDYQNSIKLIEQVFKTKYYLMSKPRLASIYQYLLSSFPPIHNTTEEFNRSIMIYANFFDSLKYINNEAQYEYLHYLVWNDRTRNEKVFIGELFELIPYMVKFDLKGLEAALYQKQEKYNPSKLRKWIKHFRNPIQLHKNRCHNLLANLLY